jgi:hypothetical protein
MVLSSGFRGKNDFLESKYVYIPKLLKIKKLTEISQNTCDTAIVDIFV